MKNIFLLSILIWGNLSLAASTKTPLSGISQSGATTGQVPKWSGTSWIASSDISGGGGGSGTVTSVTGTAPISVTASTSTPNVSLAKATTSVDGYLASGDFTTFNNKANSTLSNIGSISIPVALSPSASASSDVGDATHVWKDGFFRKILGYSSGVLTSYFTAVPEAGINGVSAPTVRSDNSGGLNIVASTSSGYLALESNANILISAGAAFPITVTNSIIPSVTDTKNLGTSSLRFNNINASGSIFGVGGSKTISMATYDLWDTGGVAALGFGFNDYVYLAQTGDGESKKLRWFEASGANYIQFGAPNSLSVDSSYTFPTSIPVTVGQFLTSNPSGDMSWASAGSVTSVATGTGLTGGPITTTGTISLANTAVTAGSYGSSSDVSVFTVDAQGRLTAATSTPILLPVSSLAQTGATTGQVIKWSGSAWAASTDSTGGGGGTTVTTAKFTTASANTASNSTVKIIDFDTSVWNDLTHGTVTTGSSWNYTANSNVQLCLDVSLTFDNVSIFTPNQTFIVYYYKNGTPLDYVDNGGTVAVEFLRKHGSTCVRLVNTDSVNIRVFQITGASQSLHLDANANRIVLTETSY